MAHNHGWAHDENFVIVYYDEPKDTYPRFTMVACRNDEENLYNLLKLDKRRKLKNLFKVNYKGQVTPFKELQLCEKVKLLIKEMTGHG